MKTKLPVLFMGHGSPMNALEDNDFTRAWIETAKRIPRPESILCISAHWQSDGTQTTAMAHPRTIHDFSGFPVESYNMTYPAPGSISLAKKVQKLLGGDNVTLDHDWGLDHGTWVLLVRMYPAADIPVVQLSLNHELSPKDHYELAGKLKSLRNEGVLILGSGNMVHNLSLMEWTDKPFDWAVDFDQQLKKLIEARDTAALIDYPRLGPNTELAIPTNEHYLPMLYALAASEANEPLRFFADEVILGSISMRCFQIG